MKSKHYCNHFRILDANNLIQQFLSASQDLHMTCCIIFAIETLKRSLAKMHLSFNVAFEHTNR